MYLIESSLGWVINYNKYVGLILHSYIIFIWKINTVLKGVRY